MSKEIECRDCGVLFDPEHPMHKNNGYYNQCCDCWEETGITEGKLKAFAGFNKDGGFEGLEIVTEAEYSAYEKAVGDRNE